MAKIYIKENQLLTIGKEPLLPQFIFKRVKEHSTSLGDNEAFPNDDIKPYDYSILKKRFSEVTERLIDYGYENIKDTESLFNKLGKLVADAKRREKPIKRFLERLVEKIVREMFSIPQETVNIECRLVDKVNVSDVINLTPESYLEAQYKFKDISDVDLSKKAVSKRRFINSLVQGAAYTYANMVDFYEEDVFNLDQELLDIYEEIDVLNEYLLFTKEEKMSDDNMQQGAFVETRVSVDDKRADIKAQGIIFPLLLKETIRGLFELFSAHGLPHDREKAKQVLRMADFVLAEPWDMRFGVTLWNELFGDVDDIRLVPYAFTILVSMPTDEFNISVKEILSKTESGEQIMSNILDNATYNSDYQVFKTTIIDKNRDRAMINDGYFSASDLDAFSLEDDDSDDILSEEE